MPMLRALPFSAKGSQASRPLRFSNPCTRRVTASAPSTLRLQKEDEGGLRSDILKKKPFIRPVLAAATSSSDAPPSQHWCGGLQMELRVRHIKGSQGEVDDKERVRIVLPIVDNANAALLDPTTSCLAILMSCKALKEEGSDGKIITTVDELVASRALAFVEVGEAPLFQNISSDGNRLGTGEPLAIGPMTEKLKMVALLVGIVGFHFHATRAHFAIQIGFSMGIDIARIFLDHAGTQLSTEGSKATIIKHYAQLAGSLR